MIRFFGAVLLLIGCGLPEAADPAFPLTAADAGELVARLRGLPDVTLTETTKPDPKQPAQARTFELWFAQPIDHDDPGQSKFRQRALLTLRYPATAPLVIVLAGYFLREDAASKIPDVADVVNGNLIQIEHRFYGKSQPARVPWPLLTVEQAARDHHVIFERLHQAFPGSAFLTTGVSKAGTAALIHYRFFPGDTDGVIAYAAPIRRGPLDDREGVYLEGHVDKSCQARLVAVQRLLLTAPRRAAVTALLARRAEEEELTYNRFGIDGAYETALIELPRSFWQWRRGTDCESIPPDSASDADWAKFVDEVAVLRAWSDWLLGLYGPWYYQTAYQWGASDFHEERLDGLLRLTHGERVAKLLPEGAVAPHFDGHAMLDVQSWLKEHGDRLLLVYGEADPVSAAAVELGHASDAQSYVVPKGNHSAEITALPYALQAEARQRVLRWVAMPRPHRP
jgi:hypothetical protein